MQYRYDAFMRRLLAEDAGFTATGAPGTRLPDFELTDVDGAIVRRSDYVGSRPLLLTFGSIT